MKKLMPGITIQKPGTQNSREQDIDTLARTLWGESRSEGPAGMEAVACVVLNRLKIARQKKSCRWGKTVNEVCRKDRQFSCWNEADVNRPRMMAVDESDIHFATALRIARRAVIMRVADVTNGATHYHTRDILPYWAKGITPCALIGRHIFYRIVQ